MVAPVGTPKAIIEKVSYDARRMLAAPEFKEKPLTPGKDPNYATLEQFEVIMKSDLVRFGKIIKTSNIKLH